MITNKSIQEVIGTARVEDVIGDFLNLRRRGVNLIGNCPFHDEKTPSFTVSPSKIFINVLAVAKVVIL
jgi:DNA primase